MPDGIAVSGLAEIRKAFKKAEDVEGTREFREGLKRAADVVAQDARRRVPAGPTGRARASIRAAAGGNRAYVIGGKSRVPYYGWLDFGTRRPTSANPRSVGPWAGTGKGPRQGRFIYPAIEATKTRVERAIEDALDKALDRVGL